MFTAVNGMLLQSVPVPDAASLVRLGAAGENHMRRGSSDYGFSLPHPERSGARPLDATSPEAMRPRAR